MTYEPKHRGEPKAEAIWRVHYRESERGWGQNFWHVDFDTEEEAQKAHDECNARNTSLHAPDYYIQADSIEKVTDA